jgi:hypothetical protein
MRFHLDEHVNPAIAAGLRRHMDEEELFGRIDFL